MLLKKIFRFEASHVLPRHPGKCSRLHGHSWVLHVSLEGRVNKTTGFVKDYAEISDAVKPLIERLDHRHLGTWGHILTDVGELEDKDHHNDWMVPGLPLNFYPSSEMLLWWVGHQLKNLDWFALALEETCTSYAELDKLEFLYGTKQAVPSGVLSSPVEDPTA